MESALDVLSRAATMVQDNAITNNEARLTSKELPTTAWRRERRLRTGEYHHQTHHHHSTPSSSASSVRATSPCRSSSTPPPVAHGQMSPSTSVNTSSSTQLHSNAHQLSMMMAAAAAVGMRPLCESTNRPSPPPPTSSHAVSGLHLGHMAHTEALQHMSAMDLDDAPLDMSVSSALKRNSPPPPYREPLPGSQFVSSLARPSVITQAPPKRELRDSTLIANRENDNRSSESIDEHFRRSLGNDYFALFAKKSPNSQSTKTPSPQPQQHPPAAHARTPPPLPVAAPASVALHTPTLTQSAIGAPPPPAYPNTSLPPAHLQQQTHSLLAAIPNNVLLSPAMAAQMKCAGEPMSASNSPPLQLVMRPTPAAQQPLALQRAASVTAPTPLPSPQSPTIKTATIHSPISSTAGSRTASPLPYNAQQALPQTTVSRFASVDNSPASSPRHTPPVTNVAVPNASPTLPAIMRIKTEPGLQNIKAHNPTPPASPTSTTNPNLMLINNNSTASSSSPSPSSPSPSSTSTATIKTNSTTSAGNSSAEVLASVDDHFAKALGDTWKRLQESKEMRK